MKTLGLIVEYNPFHNGHYYHLQESIKTSKADVVIAVMSGNFLQRGEPALVSKWTRTKMALQAGVDVVVELPYVFATQRADRFATGAVSILDALHTDELIFGSELGEIQPFLETVDFLERHPNQYKKLLKTHMQTGISFPLAASRAFLELPNRPTNTVDLTQPNNILGYHYINAVRQINRAIRVNTIRRIGAGYHELLDRSGGIASATGIRNQIFEDRESLSSIYDLVPLFTSERLTNHYKEYGQFQNWNRYFPYLKHRLITASSVELLEQYECVEGLEHRFQKAIEQSSSFSMFINRVKTKRYTWTRLQRLCTHILTNAKKETMVNTGSDTPTYIRLLGMSTKGQSYLNHVKKKVKLPIVTTVSKFNDAILDQDMKATKAYLLGFPLVYQNTLLKQEYSTPPLRYHSSTKSFNAEL